MVRLLTFVAGILVGVALKWQYDQQQMTLASAPATQPAARNSSRSSAAVQEIAITVEEGQRSTARQQPPPSPENPTNPPDAE